MFEVQASDLTVIASTNIPIETKLTTNITHYDYDVERCGELISKKCCLYQTTVQNDNFLIIKSKVASIGLKVD